MRFISDTAFSELFAEYPLYKKAEWTLLASSPLLASVVQTLMETLLNIKMAHTRC
jgi:hypothetical protein